jgi:hypothetical protein
VPPGCREEDVLSEKKKTSGDGAMKRLLDLIERVATGFPTRRRERLPGA